VRLSWWERNQGLLNRENLEDKMLKYEIGQEVWFINPKGKVGKSEIIVKTYYLRRGDKEYKEYEISGYDHKYNEDRLFASKQALLDHLSETAEEEK
jgi:hypothetical protein